MRHKTSKTDTTRKKAQKDRNNKKTPRCPKKDTN